MIEITVSDAGPVIHLDELGCLDLLEGFGLIHLPPEVQSEIAIHRPGLDLENLPALKVSMAKLSHRVVGYARSLELDAGEIAALSLLEKLRGQVFLCDDAAARVAAEAMGYRVHGTIGIILRAIRRGRRTPKEVRMLLEQIPTRSTLHLSRVLLHKVIESLPA